MSETLTEPKPTKRRKHVTPRCGAHGRHRDAPCQHEAGWGTTHPGYGSCKLHGGCVPNGIKAAALIEAAEASRVMGTPIEVDPTLALLNLISIAAGEVEYTTLRIAALKEDDAVQTFEEQQDGFEVSYTKTSNVATLHVWIRTRHDAMDRLARYAKSAIDAGVAERQVRVAEQMGGMLGKLITAVLSELELTARQLERAPGVVQRQLALVAGQPA